MMSQRTFNESTRKCVNYKNEHSVRYKATVDHNGKLPDFWIIFPVLQYSLYGFQVLGTDKRPNIRMVLHGFC